MLLWKGDIKVSKPLLKLQKEKLISKIVIKQENTLARTQVKMDSSKQDKAKPKNKEDEIDEQKNKGHRGLNKKLKKRRKQEKETKKEKKLKKKEY